MAAEYGLSGTIYDAPPVQSQVFKVGSADLNLPLGGGFQAAHIWVNNATNQYLWLEDAPDLVPPGATRVLAIKNTDVAKASWTIPPQFAQAQPAGATGAAIIIWLHSGVDIAPSPGVTNNPIVAIASNQSVAVSAIASTVTVAGTINIGNTPAVTVNGTVTVAGSVSITSGSVSITGTVTVAGSVSISSGTVTIGNTPNINIQSQSVNVATQQNPTALADLSFVGSTTATVTTGAVPTGTHSLALGVTAVGMTFRQMTVKGHQTGKQYYPAAGWASANFQGASGPGGIWSTRIPIDSAQDTTYDVTLTADINAITMKVSAILDSQAVFVKAELSDPLPAISLNGIRWPIFANVSRAVGTYTFDTQLPSGIMADTASAQGGGAGIGGRAVVYMLVVSGTGTCTIAIAQRDPSNNITGGNVVTSGATAAAGVAILRVGPGLTAAANAIANDLIGLTARYTMVVATSATAAVVSADQL